MAGFSMKTWGGTDKRDPDAITRIDYFLRDVNAAMGRLELGQVPSGSGATLPGGVTDHGALTGLTDDDHAQYLLLAGRTDGQTIEGLAAGENILSLNSIAIPTGNYLRFLTSSTVRGGIKETVGADTSLRIFGSGPTGTNPGLSLHAWDADGASRIILGGSADTMVFVAASYSFRTTLGGGAGTEFLNMNDGMISFTLTGSESVGLLGEGSTTLLVINPQTTHSGSSNGPGTVVIRRGGHDSSYQANDLMQFTRAPTETIPSGILSRIDYAGNFVGPGSTTGYVTLDTDQTITGLKTFRNDALPNGPHFVGEHPSLHPALVVDDTGGGAAGALNVYSGGIGDCTLMPGTMLVEDYFQVIIGKKFFPGDGTNCPRFYGDAATSVPALEISGASTVQQTLYPSSGRTELNDIISGTLTWNTTQTAAQAHDASDATFDRAAIVGDHIDIPNGRVGVAWTLGACTYSGVVDKVKVRIRAIAVDCSDAFIWPHFAGTEYSYQTLASSVAWYEFNFPMNPVDGLPWTAARINALTDWGWVAGIIGADEFADIYALGYEFEVLVYGSSVMSVSSSGDTGDCELPVGKVVATAAAVERGDLIAGIGATPEWTKLAKGAQGNVMVMGAEEPGWLPPTVISENTRFYLWDTASGVTGYDTLSQVPPTETQQDDYADCVGGGGLTWGTEVLCEKYMTKVGSPGQLLIPAGQWDFNFWGYVDSAVGASRLVYKVYHCAADGSGETLIFSKTGEVNIASINIAVPTALLNSYFMATETALASTTSRIVVKIYVQTSSNSTRRVHFLHSGNVFASHVHTPISGAALVHNLLSSLHQDTTAASCVADNFIVGAGSPALWTVTTPANARTALGLGTIATQAANSVSITGGAISGITDLAVADGGTGASTLAGAGLPVVVASFAAKGLTGSHGKITLLADAPIGNYLCSISVPNTFTGDSSSCQILVSFAGDSTAENWVTPGMYPLDGFPRSFVAAFTTVAVDDVSVDIQENEAIEGSTANWFVTLFRLPDAPGAAALYYCNAVPATDVDAGATITLSPAGPTFASGTSVTMTPVPSAGYHFVAWTGDSTASTNPLVFTITAAKNFGATFAAD